MKKILPLLALSLCLATPALAHEQETADSAEKRDEMFDLIDTNHDGKISRTEWDAHSKKKFAELDYKHHGYITRGEWDHFKKKEWQEWKQKYPSASSEHPDLGNEQAQPGNNEH